MYLITYQACAGSCARPDTVGRYWSTAGPPTYPGGQPAIRVNDHQAIFSRVVFSQHLDVDFISAGNAFLRWYVLVEGIEIHCREFMGVNVFWRAFIVRRRSFKIVDERIVPCIMVKCRGMGVLRLEV